MKRFLYRHLLRPALFQLSPEHAHEFAMLWLRAVSMLGPGRPFRAGETELLGLCFPNRVGLAAGFDKNALALSAWQRLGFGFIEIGTITALPQPGNPKPRVFRYPGLRALVNRMGFNNDGAEALARRLDRWKISGRWPSVPIGINLGKSKVTDLADAPADYAASFRALHRFADYIAVNVSSPNTPGLRTLQGGDELRGILRAIAAENRGRRVPILVKVAPDLDDESLPRLVAVAEEEGIQGFIATNTTLDHSALPQAQDEQGGLSGAPLLDKSTALLRRIRASSALPIIGSGGIMSDTDASEKIAAGAQLVQLYTGFVYEGPGLVKRTARALAGRGLVRRGC